MLVAENRDSLARFFENLDDLLKQLVTRVKNLAKLVYRVVAVLNDQGDRIDVEAAGSAQRLGHGLDEPDAVPLTKAQPQVVGRRLVVVHPDHLQDWLVVDAVLLKPK